MKQLTGPELLAMAARPDAPRPLLLDVREPWEFALASIVVDDLTTLHLPMNEIPARLGTLDPQQPVVCICHHGVRSAHVAAFLEREGFEAVWNLAGGIDAWSAQVDAAVPRY